MPRRAPIDPQGYYHVSTRGNFGQPLFNTPGEHELYLRLYAKYARELGWSTLCWCLLWNHHHFLIELSEGGLSEGMRAINHGFARRVNAIYGRTGEGHLVRHCFFAGAIESDAHFKNVCRYIDLNPVMARQCRRPQDWPWCGFAGALGLVRPRPFHDVRALLSQFGSRPDRARAAYARHVTQDPVPGNGYRTVTASGLPDLRVVESPA